MPARTATSEAPGALGAPLQVLYDAPDQRDDALPAALRTAYGGALRLPVPRLYGNFVASLDGVVALGPEHPSSGSAISGREPADRFVMALLRAHAAVVLVGAGTLRATPRHEWTPEHVWPDGAEQFAALRGQRGLDPRPLLAVVTAGGGVPPEHPALQHRSLVITTAAGADRLAGRLPPSCTAVAAGDGPTLPTGAVVAVLRDATGGSILTEGGPRLLGQLIDTGALDELFLTVAPVVAGRGATPRPGLVSGVELLPRRRTDAELVSARRHGSFVFLRYRFANPEESRG